MIWSYKYEIYMIHTSNYLNVELDDMSKDIFV